MLDYEMPFDGHEIWAGVEEKLYGKKKKRGWWVWWLGGLVLVAVCAGSLYLFAPYMQIPANHKSKNISYQKNPVQQDVQTLNPSEAQNDTKELRIGQNVSSSASSGTSLQEDGTSFNKTNNTNRDEKDKETSRKPKTPSHKIIASMTADPQDVSMSTSTQTASTLRDRSSNGAKDEIKNSQAATVHKKAQSQGVAESNKRMIPGFPGLPGLSVKAIFGRDWKQTIISYLLLQMIYSKEEQRKKNDKKQKYTPLNIGYAMSAQAGYGFIRRQLEASQKHLEYLELRKLTETPLEALQAQVAMDVFWKKHWKVNLGLNYTRINEEMTYSYTGYSDDFIRDTIIKYLKDNTRSISYKDRKLAYDSAFHTYNAHEMVGLSMEVGYRWKIQGNWNFSLNAGAKYNFFQRSRGYQTTAQGKVAAFHTRSDRRPLYKTHGNLWLTSTMNMGYEWREEHEILFSLSEQFLLNNLANKANNPIYQGYNLHFVRMGYRYHF